jgi:hypothetical protein
LVVYFALFFTTNLCLKVIHGKVGEKQFCLGKMGINFK